MDEIGVPHHQYYRWKKKGGLPCSDAYYTSMNVNESAAASTKVVGAAAKVSRVLSWMLSNGTNTDMTVSEIAYEVGFNDPKYFTRCFAKEFGATPSEMQKKG